MAAQPDSAPGMKAAQVPQVDGVSGDENGVAPLPSAKRKRIVVAGLGMVGIAFM